MLYIYINIILEYGGINIHSTLINEGTFHWLLSLYGLIKEPSCCQRGCHSYKEIF